jgi:1-deoxy-D-xylulose-5-phosphate synthase
MAFEALNNLGHSNTPCVIILNDNGRSYAPTVSKLSANLTKIRMHPTYLNARKRFERRLKELTNVGSVGEFAYSTAKSLKAAVREFVEPQTFFEALGVRYLGPIDGHDIFALEEAMRSAQEWDGPIVVHALTQKGRGYSPAENDDEKHLHDAPVFDPMTGPEKWRPAGYTQAFSDAIVAIGASDPRVRTITAAMPGPTGLIPFSERFPDRFIDVGIAEQHAATMAAGLAMGGLRPIVAIYSTFFNRCFDQAAYDVALHKLPVVFVLDRAGITGDDGASHHGVLDMSLCLNIPGMTILAPSSAQDLSQMLRYALTLDGPAVIRFPKGPARNIDSNALPPYVVGMPLPSERLATGSDVCILAIGKMVETAETVVDMLAAQGVAATLWDVRSVRPLDTEMLRDALTHPDIYVVEDGICVGGAGSWIADQLRELHQSIVGSRRHIDRGPAGEAEVIDVRSAVDLAQTRASHHSFAPRWSPNIHLLGIPVTFIPHAKPTAIHQDLGLDAHSITNRVLADRSPVAATQPLHD